MEQAVRRYDPKKSKERKKKLSPLKTKVADLQSKLTSEIDEFSKVRAKIIEDNNSTRMICNRVRDHLHLRLAVYWNSVLRNHPDSGKMPVVPCVDIGFKAEEVYIKPHYNVLMETAEILSKAYSCEEKEKENV